MKMDSGPQIFARRRSRSPLPFTPTTWRPTGDWAGAVHHGSGAGPGSGGGSGVCGAGGRAALKQVAPLPCQPQGLRELRETRRPHNRCARPQGRARAAA